MSNTTSRSGFLATDDGMHDVSSSYRDTAGEDGPMLSRLLQWTAVAVLLFFLVNAFALTNVYVEGDDASAVLYHALDRQLDLQEPYAQYHAGMDILLTALPADEAIVRTAGLWVSSIGAIAFAIMLGILSLLEFRQDAGRAAAAAKPPSWAIALVVLLAMPELFYLGLIYSPAILAMAMVVGAHLLARRSLHDTQNGRFGLSSLVWASIGLFALGVSLRWPVLSYGLVIVADLAFSGRKGEKVRALVPAFYWGTIAFVAGTVTIVASALYFGGIPWGSLMTSISNRGASTGNTALLNIESLVTMTPLLTPALLLLAAIGAIDALRHNPRLLLMLIAGVLSVLPWLPTGVPKFLLPIVPPLCLLAVLGLARVWTYRPHIVMRTGLAALLLAPWVIGAEVIQPGSAWGPGFEQRAIGRPADPENLQTRQVSFTLGSGVAFPTPEGPRALGGHGFTFLGGAWRAFAEGEDRERKSLVEQALARDLPILVTRWSPDEISIDLVSRGYATKDPDTNTLDDSPIIARRFEHPERDGDVMVYFLEIQGEPDKAQLALLQPIRERHENALLYGYSRTMRALYRAASEKFAPYGKSTAMLDLDFISSVEP